MKTLIQLVLAVFLTGTLNAQTTAPEPPKAPTNYSSTHSSSTSVSKTDDDYHIKARFHKSRYDAVKSLLTDKLGKDGLTVKGDTYAWSHGTDNFECKLTKTSLKLYLDYESANDTFISHIEDLGTNLKYAVSGGDPKEDVKRAEDELSRAQKELERAKANVSRLKKN